MRCHTPHNKTVIYQEVQLKPLQMCILNNYKNSYRCIYCCILNLLKENNKDSNCHAKL